MIKYIFGSIIFFTLFQCKIFDSQVSTFSTLSEQNNTVNYLEYYKNIYRADSLFLIGNFTDSYKILDKTFHKFKPKNQFQTKEIEKYIILSNKLNKKIDYNYYFELLFKESIFNNFEMSNNCQTIFNLQNIGKTEIEKWKFNYHKSVNQEYNKELKLMFDEDQESRGKNNEWEIDEENYRKFIKLYDKFGYPEQSTTHEGKNYLPILFFHLSRVDNYSKLKSIVLENLRLGKATPEEAEALISSKYLIFYHHNYFDKEDINNNFSKLIKSNKPLDTFNLRRFNAGLPTKQYEDWKNKNFR